MSELQSRCDDAPAIGMVERHPFAIESSLLWMNILALDAPLVAVVWQDFFARSFGARPVFAARAVLFVSVWLAYTADRWLDAWRIPPCVVPTARHQFARRHRKPLGVVWLLVLVATINASNCYLPAYFFRRGLWLAGGVVVYLFLNQWPVAARWLHGFKEIAVGMLFTAGTLIFMPREEINRPEVLVWAAISWCLLGFLNCYGIAYWEREQDAAQKQRSIITRWPRLGGAFTPMALVLALFALVPIGFGWHGEATQIRMAVAMSSIALALLDVCKDAIPTGLIRVLADMTLLTPLMFRLI